MNYQLKFETVIEQFRSLTKEEQESVIHMLELCGGGKENGYGKCDEN